MGGSINKQLMMQFVMQLMMQKYSARAESESYDEFCVMSFAWPCPLSKIHLNALNETLPKTNQCNVEFESLFIDQQQNI